MKNLKNILVVLVIGIIIVAGIAMFSKDEEKEIQEENGKLIMVTEAGFAPYEFYEGEEIVGVDIEIAKK